MTIKAKTGSKLIALVALLSVSASAAEIHPAMPNSDFQSLTASAVTGDGPVPAANRFHEPSYLALRAGSLSLAQAPTTETTVDGESDEEQDTARLLQQALFKIYRSNLLKKTYQHVVYPESSIDRNEEGDVVLRVQIRRDGKVKRIGYESKARSHALNLAARAAVKRAKPFAPAPSELQGESFEILMPIRFRLTE